jgi:hypothetical protein
MLLAACSTKEIDIQTPVQDDVVFYASFEQPAEDETRVYANEDLLLRWTSDDRVSIFNKLTYNQEYKFTGQTGANAGGFKKVDNDEFVTGNAISHVFSVYPYQESTAISEGEEISLTLPAEQHYAENTFGLGANTMVSVSDDNVLMYKNVGGYLMLKLYGEGVSVSSITLKGNNGEKLAGNATVTMPADGLPSVSMASDASTEITLTCETPVQLGASAAESTQFWFVVPPVTFSKGFTITVNDSYGGTFKKSTTKSVAIERNILTRMSPIEVVVEPKRTVTITAVLGEETRTSNDGSLKWEAGDQINVLVTDGSIQKQVTFITAESGHEVQFTGEVEEGFYLMGVATYAMIFDIEKNAWIIPSSVTVDPDNPLSSVPLIGTDASDNRYLFHASTGVFEFNVRNVPLNAAYAVLETIGEDAPSLWGELKSIPEDGIVTMNALSGGGKKLISMGAPAEPNTTLTYWFFVPIGNLPAEKAQFSLCDAYGNVVKNLLFPIDIEVKANTIRVFSIPFDPIPIPEAVDLGLPSGLKWASFNLGASKPEEYGDYYAWGETEPYYSSLDPLTWKEGKEAGYNWASYKWCMGSTKTMTKYCDYSLYGYNSFTDNKTVLDPEDDAAHVNLGGNWRMPTDAEWTELRNNCTWTWITQNGVNGRQVTGTNGNSIFLPACGCRSETSLLRVGSSVYYWSSSLFTDIPSGAWYVYFYSGDVGRGSSSRYHGFPIRPISE